MNRPRRTDTLTAHQAKRRVLIRQKPGLHGQDRLRIRFLATLVPENPTCPM